MILDFPTVFKASSRDPPGISSITIRMYSPGLYWILKHTIKVSFLQKRTRSVELYYEKQIYRCANVAIIEFRRILLGEPGQFSQSLNVEAAV